MNKIIFAIAALAIAGCALDPQPVPDTRPHAESTGSIVMPGGWSAQVVVLPTRERVLMVSRSWMVYGGSTAHCISAVLLPPVQAEGQGVGP